MTNAYALTDTDFNVPSSNNSNYMLTNDDFSTEQTPIVAANVPSIPFVTPDIDYKNQLGSLGAYLAAIPKRFGEMGANANKYLSNALGLKPPPDPFSYPQGSFLQQLEQQHPTATALGNATTDIGTMMGINPTSIAELAGIGATQGALTNPQSPIKSGLIEGSVGAGAGALGKGLEWATNTVGNALKGPVAAAANRLNITLPIGEASQMPLLTKFSQNTLTRLPFSGATSGYAQTGQQLDKAVSDALNEIKPSSSISQIPGNIQQALKSSYNDAQQIKRTLYNNVSSRADDIGVGVTPTTYLQGYDEPTTGEHIPGINDLLNQSKDILSRSPELQLSGGTQDFLQKIANASGEPKSFGETSLVMGKLNNFASQLSASGNTYESSLIKGLRPLLAKDMEQSAYNSGDPSLIDEWQKAQLHYANNVAPFDDPNLEKYLQSGSKADNPDLLISNFLKTGQNNQPTLLNKLLSKMPEDQKNDIGYYFLTKSLPRDETGSPIINRNTVTRFNNNLQNYDPQIRNQLIPEHIQQTLKDVDTVGKTVPNLLLNPPTGSQMADLSALGGLGSIFAGGAALGHPALGATAVGGALGGGRAANALLRSSAFQNFLKSNPNTMKLGQLLSAGVNAG